jgi:hypothetical protein
MSLQNKIECCEVSLMQNHQLLTHYFYQCKFPKTPNLCQIEAFEDLGFRI